MTKTRFVFESPGAQRVYLAGDFNDWDPEGQRMRRVRKAEDVFVAWVDLEPGLHEFKYVVDGEWLCDPHAARVPNAVGTDNSVVEVAA